MKSPYEVFMRLVRRLAVYRSQLVCALIGTFIQVAMTIYLPILIGHAIDMVAVSNKIDFHQLTNIIMAILIVTVINALTQWLTPRLYNQMTYQTIQQLRQEVFETIHRVPMSFLDSRSSGDLVSRLTTDLDQLMEGILMVFNQFLVGVLTILATIITMAQLDIWMMLIVVMLTPLSLEAQFQNPLMRTQIKQAQGSGNLGKIAQIHRLRKNAAQLTVRTAQLRGNLS